MGSAQKALTALWKPDELPPGDPYVRVLIDRVQPCQYIAMRKKIIAVDEDNDLVRIARSDGPVNVLELPEPDLVWSEVD